MIVALLSPFSFVNKHILLVWQKKRGKKEVSFFLNAFERENRFRFENGLGNKMEGIKTKLKLVLVT